MIVIVKNVIFNHFFYWLVSSDLPMIMPSDECHRTLMMIRQYWFRYRLGAVRQQVITWANVDSVPCRLMASLGHNELINGWIQSCLIKSRPDDYKWAMFPRGFCPHVSLGTLLVTNHARVWRAHYPLLILHITKSHVCKRPLYHKITGTRTGNEQMPPSIL